MQCILSALKFESIPFIKHFGLEKDDRFDYPVFANGKIYLIVVGIGKKSIEKRINNFIQNLDQKFPQFINIGTAGGKKDKHVIGDAFLINKIIDHYSKQVYYPDILIRHPFKESSIITVEESVHDGGQIFPDLVDMEASEIFKVCSKFCKLHNMIFIKIVSDHMNIDIKTFDQDYLLSLFQNKLQDIENFLQRLRDFSNINKSILFKTDREWIINTTQRLRLTRSQAIRLKMIFKGYRLRNPNASCPAIDDFKPESKLKRNTKFQNICAILTS